MIWADLGLVRQFVWAESEDRVLAEPGKTGAHRKMRPSLERLSAPSV